MRQSPWRPRPLDLPESTLDKVTNVLMIGLLVALLLSIAAGLMLV